MALEAQEAINYSFITLTYADEHLPEGFSVKRGHIKPFIDKIKKRLGQVRYFAVGEYGDEKGRPHYHAILFGMAASEQTRKLVDDSWPYGRTETQHPRTRGAMAYCLGYVTKKMTSFKDDRLDGRYPEFFSCSLKPPLGRAGLNHIAKMLNTRQGSLAIAENGFPRGFTLDGQYYPFFRRDRDYLMEQAGYGDCDDMEHEAENLTWLQHETYALYLQAQQSGWTAARLRDAIHTVRTQLDAQETERRREAAVRRAEKRRRKYLQNPKTTDVDTELPPGVGTRHSPEIV